MRSLEVTTVLGRLAQVGGCGALALGAFALLFAFSPANTADAPGLLRGAALWLPIGGVVVALGTFLVRRGRSRSDGGRPLGDTPPA